eukprot:136519_1
MISSSDTHSTKPCDSLHWNEECITEIKPHFEAILNRKFTDNEFIDKIKILYAIVRRKSHDQDSQSMLTNKYPDVMNEIYSSDFEPETLSFFNIIPIKIDYFMFNARFNNNFKHISYHKCDHNTYINLNRPSSLAFILFQTQHIKHNLKYNRKLKSTPFSEFLPFTQGCCMQCAELATPEIINCCYSLTSYQRDNKHIKQIPNSHLIPYNIDTLCLLCLWLANILQHKYIKIILRKNEDLMPTILLTLVRLLHNSHFLYKDANKLYDNRRTMIDFSIWRLVKALIMNHGYIKKYYQNKDVDNDNFCELYLVEVMRWLKRELKILNCMFEKYDTMEIKYDYFGGMLILMTLLRYKGAKFEVKQITHHSMIFDYMCLMNFWVTQHLISHNMGFIGKFFKKSIIKSRQLIAKSQIKCQWRDCKKWRKQNKLYKCKKCKAVTYCSRSCQKKGWKLGYHRFVCETYL